MSAGNLATMLMELTLVVVMIPIDIVMQYMHPSFDQTTRFCPVWIVGKQRHVQQILVGRGLLVTAYHSDLESFINYN